MYTPNRIQRLPSPLPQRPSCSNIERNREIGPELFVTDVDDVNVGDSASPPVTVAVADDRPLKLPDNQRDTTRPLDFHFPQSFQHVAPFSISPGRTARYRWCIRLSRSPDQRSVCTGWHCPFAPSFHSATSKRYPWSSLRGSVRSLVKVGRARTSQECTALLRPAGTAFLIPTCLCGRLVVKLLPARPCRYSRHSALSVVVGPPNQMSLPGNFRE